MTTYNLPPGVKLRSNSNEVTGYPTHQHIVYFHRDPKTYDVVYVGEGKVSRAYEINNRNIKHFLWLYHLLEQGYTMEEIVDVRSGGYTKTEAKAVERHNIERCLREGCKLFNQNHNPYKPMNEDSNGIYTELPDSEAGAGETAPWPKDRSKVRH